MECIVILHLSLLLFFFSQNLPPLFLLDIFFQANKINRDVALTYHGNVATHSRISDDFWSSLLSS